jgi:hypothetical protein
LYRSRRFLLGWVAAATLAIALPACGGGGSSEPDGATAAGGGNGAGAGSGGAAKQSGAAQGSQGAPNAELSSSRCQSQLAGFLGSMDRLRDRLVAGVSYRQYVEELKAVRGAYERLPVKRLGLDCLQLAGRPAENGFNEYIAAGNAWGDCVEVAGCRSSSIEGRLQQRWRAASKLLSKVQTALAQN